MADKRRYGVENKTSFKKVIWCSKNVVRVCLCKVKGQTLKEDQYNTFKTLLTSTTSCSLLPVSLTHTHIRSFLVMEILQTCNSRTPLLGLLRISTQTHFLLDHVCRKPSSVNPLKHHQYHSETILQTKTKMLTGL